MATKAVYTLLSLIERSGTQDGPAFPTAQRTGWTFEIHVPVVGTSVTVKLQATSAGLEDSDWEDRHEVTITSAGTTKVTNDDDGSTGIDTQITDRDRWIRASISDNDGEHVVEVTGRAPFFDPDDPGHKDLLSKTVAGAEELTRIVERAEARVLNQALDMDRRGRLQADLTSPVALDLIRDAVAAQTEIESKRDDLMESNDMSAAFTSRGERVPGLAPEVTSLLSPILAHSGATVWKGRG